jgi:hypothetical protein
MFVFVFYFHCFAYILYYYYSATMYQRIHVNQLQCLLDCSILYIFSTVIDGEIKAWLYDFLGLRVNYDVCGNWCTTMTYNAKGTRCDVANLILISFFCIIG